MRRPVDPATFAGLVVNHGDPKGQRRLERPRRAAVRARLYDGTVQALELDVVWRAPGFVCVRQGRDGAPPRLAWIPEDQARPL